MQEFAGSDYACRFFVPKAVWVKVLAALADETNYDEISRTKVARPPGKKGAAYGRTLHQVWQTMLELQK